MLKRKNWLVLHGKQYKRCGWRKCVIKKRTNILLVDDHEVAMYYQEANKHQQTIEQTEVIQEEVLSEVSQL